MTRPTYERRSDIENERRIAAIAEEVWRCNLLKMPKRYVLDYLAVRGVQPSAAIEIKRRSGNRHDTFETFFISASKVLEATRWRAAFDIPTFVVVEFSDGVFYSSLEGRFPVTLAGRRDRGDPEDIEPMAHIPANELFPLKG